MNNNSLLSAGGLDDRHQQGGDSRYLPALDGLRAVAVLAVLYDHTAPEWTPVGHYGVRVFFVLSGFLVTGILLRAREQARGGGMWGFYKAFLARRALRLFPAYYLLVLILLAANMQNIREVAIWHLLHLSSVLFSMKNAYVPSITAHHWSLSVEALFYLFWPFVVLYVPRRRLYAAFWVMTL